VSAKGKAGLLSETEIQATWYISSVLKRGETYWFARVQSKAKTQRTRVLVLLGHRAAQREMKRGGHCASRAQLGFGDAHHV
jgi:hypothetical protein